MSHAVPTLFDIVYGLADELGLLQYGIATGGTTSTLLDSDLTLGDFQDDTWQRGTAFITYDAGGSNAAPEGEMSEITAYTDSSGTLASVWTAAPAAGDHYAIGAPDWELSDLIRIVNHAFVRMGPVPQLDTSLSTVANVTEYTLPAAVRGTLRRVYIDQYTTTDNTRPQEISNWDREAALNAGELIFPVQPATGRVISLRYMAPHPQLDLQGDLLSSFVPLRRIISEATFLALRSRNRQGSDNDLKAAFNDAADDVEQARKMFPILDIGLPFKPILRGKRKGDRRRKYGRFFTGS